ncbi:MAG TPA: pilus assembly protein TadG-related protein [Terracidiphilus sp.]|jgi:Flp pilus assembly protein TadG|nr:pilus assembly protein TadG-related protein [Terracidiphilus sp.]
MKNLRIVSEENGSILAVTALSLVVILAILGFAVDVGRFRYVKRNLQNAADAAALAAALEARTCGTTEVCSAMQGAAQDALTENGLSATTTLTNCGGTAGTGVTLTVNNPPCAISTDPNKGKTNYAEAIVSEQVPTYFAGLVGMRSVTVTARAEAGRGVGGPCIYALDPTGPAITILAGVIVNSRCPVVDESASSNALSCVVGVFLYAPKISVSGGSNGLLCLATSTPATYVPAPNPRDPLAYLPAPSTANNSCGTTTGSPYTGSPTAVNVILGGNVTFNPGVYCGGINITASLLSNITFNPGTYILKDGTGLLGVTQGGLNINLNTLTNITGNGVTFYNEGPNGGFSVTEPVTGGSLLSLGNVNLTAPSSGTYGGVLFFQEHGVTSSGVFLASLLEKSNLQGAIYLPDASVSYGVGAISSAYNILVAKDINLVGTVASSFGNDYSSLSGGSPLNGNDVALVQ